MSTSRKIVIAVVAGIILLFVALAAYGSTIKQDAFFANDGSSIICTHYSTGTVCNVTDGNGNRTTLNDNN